MRHCVGHPSGARRSRYAPRPELQYALPNYLEPGSIASARELAELIAAGEWAPASYRGSDGSYVIEKIVLGIMHGAAVGLGPFAAIHAIAVIDDHPTIWGDGALALVERSGLLQDMREDYTDDAEEGRTAVCMMRRRSWPTAITRRFSMQMAEEAGLTQKEGPWQTYPRRMLMMRARSWALRDGFADVLRGLAIREEVDDYDNLGAPLPETGIGRSPLQSASRFKRPIPRPRFADYVARTAARGDESPEYSTDGRRSGCPSHASSGANAEPYNENSALSGRSEETSNVRDRASDLLEAESSPSTPLTVDPSTGEPFRDTTYELISADGSLVAFDSPGALRDAFSRLFVDPYLSAAQILGLWESNEFARTELERAFGDAALEDADRRRQSAAEEQAVHSLPHSTHSRQMPGSKDRSGSQTDGAVGVAPAVCLQLLPHPSWSINELFRHYRSELLNLKRGRATAAAFVDFRPSNSEIEERLRHRLPHLINKIDVVYAWAALHAR